MNEYIINMKAKHELLSFLDGAYGVGFTHDRTSGGKAVTFCVIRQGISQPCFCGCTICNPLDTYNQDKGEREAFKRAVTSLLNHYGVFDYEDDNDEKYMLSRFRGALRNAKLGEKK